MRQRGQTSVRSRGRGEEHEDRLPSDVEVTTAARHRHQVVVTQDAVVIDGGNDRRGGPGDLRAMIGTVVGWQVGTLERADGCPDGVDGDVEGSPRCRLCVQRSVDGRHDEGDVPGRVVEDGGSC